jgi:hypothetical protein
MVANSDTSKLLYCINLASRSQWGMAINATIRFYYYLKESQLHTYICVLDDLRQSNCPASVKFAHLIVARL